MPHFEDFYANKLRGSLGVTDAESVLDLREANRATAEASIGDMLERSRFAKGKTVTPSDTVDLAAYAAGVVVVTAGNLKVLPSQNADADAVTFTNAPVGFIPPFQVRRVFATGTTAAVASLDN